MENALKLVGRNSGEIFLLRYPSSILDFCGFDLSYFAKNAIEACSEAQKTGQINTDIFAELRRDLQSSHCYIGHNIRTIYEKTAVDCWIDYLCRRDNIGTGALWNRYISCRTPFDKLVFSRLCEFRYNKAINEWLNIVRVQDYAKSKIDFVFTKDVKNAKEAASRRNYFDLMFSVTAREMGCRLEDLGEIKIFSVGRTPSSPFMFSSISKDIVRHVLADFDYSDDYSDIGDYSEISDQIAMDAFSKMKSGLPAELSSYNIVRGKMENYTDKIYMPCSLKAAVDLEIDAIIESGGILCACKRCGHLYLRNEDYNEDYCRTYLQNGKSCLEIFREENPEPKISPKLEEKCARVTDNVYSRVGTSMSTKEYEYWYSYMNAMKEKVASGEITPEELDNFLDYSLNVDISRSKPIVEVPRHDDRPSRERVVKPFIPERISRSDLKPSQSKTEEDTEDEETSKEGFFVSPTVFRHKNEGQQISHIIRGGETRGESYDLNPDPSGFQPFGQPSKPVQIQPDVQNSPENRAQEDLKRLEKKLEEDRQLRAELERRAVQNSYEPKPYEGTDFSDTDNFKPFSRKNTSSITASSITASGNTANGNTAGSFNEDFDAKEPPHEEKHIEEEHENPTAPRAKVIRKNAAAISAYGKMSGTPVKTVEQEAEELKQAEEAKSDYPHEEISVQPQAKTRAEIAADYPAEEPFRDIGSIFDVLEQSENDMSGKSRKKSYYESEEPSPEWEKTAPRTKRSSQPAESRKESREEPPSGFWTEERNLFPSENAAEPRSVDTRSELDMLKEKKHSKTNKTRRLYDVIMREPDDNPNFRRKG